MLFFQKKFGVQVKSDYCPAAYKYRFYSHATTAHINILSNLRYMMIALSDLVFCVHVNIRSVFFLHCCEKLRSQIFSLITVLLISLFDMEV